MTEIPVVNASPQALGLNPAQQEACEHLQGQLMVLAGPGTGKTRVITHRFLNLLNSGVSTENIAVFTFTVKAANEMEERISALCQTGFQDLFVSTFHAFALRFLQQEGHRLPIPRPFRIAADVERWQLMCRVLERLRPDQLYRLPRPRDVAPDLLKLLERAKQEMAGPEDYQRIAADMVMEARLGADVHVQVAAVYSAYQDELVHAGLLDFDDTIYWSVRLLERDPEVLRRWREKLTHVMVDEFQDTNFSQLRLVEMLAGEQGNVAVVGDDDQSIYKFRGASVANLRRFRQVYPSLRIVRLETNYRSTRQVLSAANRLVSQNQERVRKEVVSDRDGGPARLYLAADTAHEVAWTVERIAELLETGAQPAGEIAVLVRTNAQLRPYTRALQRAGIPYQLSGGRGFLDQPEIKDLRALLRWAVDPGDTQAAARVLGMPGVEVPSDDILALTRACDRDGSDLEECAKPAVERALGAEDDARRAVAEHLKRALDLVREVRAQALRDRADEVVYVALERTRYVDLLSYPSEIQRRQAGANIEKFVDMAATFSQAAGDDDGTMAAFMAQLDAIEESASVSASAQSIPPIDTGRDAVNLMTVHQAKGLEFGAVICPGLVEDRFPYRSQGEALPLPQELIVEEVSSRDPRLAEERRLCYVAVTRAKTHLFLSAAQRYEGFKKWKPSRFLADMGFLPAPDGTTVEPLAAEPEPAVEVPQAPVAQATLPLDHPEVPELVASYSQLEAYRTCPRAYQYRYTYHLPTRPSAEQQFGVAVHQALSTILQEATDGQPPLERAQAIFDAAFALDRFCDPVNLDLWQARGRDFVAALHRRGRLDGRILHVAPEQAFNLSLPGFRLKGRIDRIDRAKNGFRLIDYKTGDVKDEWQLERDLQLGLYAIAAEQVFGLRPVTLAICYLEDAIEVEVLKTTSQLQADEEHATDLAAGIIAGDFTPQPSPWKCARCDFRLVCDAAV
ncbi:MAG: ATP-dependent helicase UvrD/PcrA [Chloroflexota bacterium]|jgi:DNA helicase-2/ATP-dependent DNA helicase PcrA|nr:ATP-dependent helicase UvrD/PcrA [Chloroflexota bacterium]